MARLHEGREDPPRGASWLPHDTLVRRAQYCIDHEWFLEAGEALAAHKEPSNHGGAGRRFQTTSGHNRWSVHSMNLTNNIIQNTHRGEPIAADRAVRVDIEKVARGTSKTR